jgi:hypothetical protein
MLKDKKQLLPLLILIITIVKLINAASTPKVNVDSGKYFTYTAVQSIPKSTTYTSTFAGKALPSWLSFDKATTVFSGITPILDASTAYTVVVTSSKKVTTTFNLVIQGFEYDFVLSTKAILYQTTNYSIPSNVTTNGGTNSITTTCSIYSNIDLDTSPSWVTYYSTAKVISITPNTSTGNQTLSVVCKNGNVRTYALLNIMIQCTDGYFGSRCSNYTCFSISAMNSSVCNGHGFCSKPDTCVCSIEYIGSNCQEQKCPGFLPDYCNVTYCFNILSNDSSVCGSHGNCTSYNTCVCNEGYSGSNCTDFQCFKNNYRSTEACSAHGSCIAPDTCTCNSPYLGATCSDYVCWNISPTDSTVCSAHGTCIGPDSCQCLYGYIGNICANVTCHDIPSSSTSVCSGNGDCIDVDQCACNEGWLGSECSVLNNEVATCFGHNNSQVDTVCSGNGVCIDSDVCLCSNNYFGETCSITECFGILSNDSSVCSGRGICYSANHCSCSIQGYSGAKCEIMSCNVKGPNDLVCSGHGSCMQPDVCACNINYTGSDCHIALCNGISPSDSSVCSGNGSCNINGVCECNYGYTGTNCNSYTCYGLEKNNPQACSSQGQCRFVDTCICDSGNIGPQCEYPVCGEYPSNDTRVCSGKGNCSSSGVCDCLPGYNGTQCDEIELECFKISSLDPSVCSSRGFCIQYNNCSCSTGYTGEKCEIPICFGNIAPNLVCSGSGKCIEANVCKCDSGYSGGNCELFSCYAFASNSTDVCHSRGECIAPDVCICSEGFYGDCSEYNCFGIPFNSSDVCSGRGTCIAPNQCDNCRHNSTGIECDIALCYGRKQTHKSVCSGHGMCVDTDTCNCNEGYTGNNCSIHTCFNVSSSDPEVCSGHGTCTALNTCSCFNSDSLGYYSNDDCSSCQRNYNGTNCLEKFCDDQDTCLGRGVCTANFECDCSTVYTSSYAPPFCDKCLPNYYGSGCSKYCLARSQCLNRGDCDSYGNCKCFYSKDKGFFVGSRCSKCADGFFGISCNIGVFYDFVFDETGSQISGTLIVPSVITTKVPCTSLIASDQLDLIGSYSECILMDSTLVISLGTDATLEANGTLNINIYGFSDTIQVEYMTVPIQPPLKVATPVAVLKAPSKISHCGVTLDGTESYSLDGRILEYYWEVTTGGNYEQMNLYLAGIHDRVVEVPADLFSTNSSVYQFSLTVKNFFGGIAQTMVNIEKSDDVIPVVLSSNELTVNRFDSLKIQASIIESSCLSNEQITYEWKQTVGPAVLPPVLDKTLEIFPFTFPAIATSYTFQLTTSILSSPEIVTITTAVVNVVFSDISASIQGGSDRTVLSSQPLELTVLVNDPDETTEILMYYWSCDAISGEDYIIDEIIESQMRSETLNIPASSLQLNEVYIFSVQVLKGNRKASASATIRVRGTKYPTVTLSSLPLTTTSNKIIVSADVSPVTSTVSWYLNDLTIPDSMKIFSSNKYLVLSTDNMQVGVLQTIKLVAVDPEDPANFGYAQVTTVTSKPPVPGVIHVIPDSGISMHTEFELSTDQWSHPIRPLQFNFLLYDVTQDTYIYESGFSSDKKLITKLPHGKTPSLQLKVVARDKYGVTNIVSSSITVTSSNSSGVTWNEVKGNITADIGSIHRLSELCSSISIYSSLLNEKDIQTSSTTVIKQQIREIMIDSILNLLSTRDTREPVTSSTIRQLAIVLNVLTQMTSEISSPIQQKSLVALQQIKKLSKLSSDPVRKDTVTLLVSTIIRLINFDATGTQARSVVSKQEGELSLLESLDNIIDDLIQDSVPGQDPAIIVQDDIVVHAQVFEPTSWNIALYRIPSPKLTWYSNQTVNIQLPSISNITNQKDTVSVHTTILATIPFESRNLCNQSHLVCTSPAVSITLRQNGQTILANIVSPVIVQIPGKFSNGTDVFAVCSHYNSSASAWIENESCVAKNYNETYVTCSCSSLGLVRAFVRAIPLPQPSPTIPPSATIAVVPSTTQSSTDASTIQESPIVSNQESETSPSPSTTSNNYTQIHEESVEEEKLHAGTVIGVILGIILAIILVVIIMLIIVGIIMLIKMYKQKQRMKIYYDKNSVLELQEIPGPMFDLEE